MLIVKKCMTFIKKKKSKTTITLKSGLRSQCQIRVPHRAIVFFSSVGVGGGGGAEASANVRTKQTTF